MEIEIQQLIEYHGVRITPLSNEKLNWCIEQFGGLYTDRCFLKGNYLYFKNEEDLTWYLIYWG